MSNWLANTVSQRKTISRHLFFFGVLCTLVFLAACNIVYVRGGLYYRLQRGDTLAAVARTYGVKLQELAEINDIQDPDQMKVGSSIFIPRATVIKPLVPPPPKAKGPSKKGKPGKVWVKEEKEDRIVYDRSRFIWPVNGRLTSRYGARRGVKHHGIDVAARKGTPILAAASGRVGFSGRLRGYGNVVLLTHADNFFTVYAHTSVNLVKKGQSVKKGELIAKVGSTGHSTGPHLHFEVHKGRQTRNPLFFLPQKK